MLQVVFKLFIKKTKNKPIFYLLWVPFFCFSHQKASFFAKNEENQAIISENNLENEYLCSEY